MEFRKIFYNKQFVVPLLIFAFTLIAYFVIKENLFAGLELNNTIAYILVFFVLYLGAQFLAAVIDFLTGKYSFSINNLFVLWGSYLWMTFIHLLLLVFAIPLLLFLFLMGPVAFIGGLIAMSTLFIFVIQGLMGYQLVAHPPDRQLALYALLFILFFIGLYTFVLRRNLRENILMDNFSDFYLKWVYRPAARFNREILSLMDL